MESDLSVFIFNVFTNLVVITTCSVGVYVARVLITILMAMLIIGGGVAVYFIVQTLKSGMYIYIKSTYCTYV